MTQETKVLDPRMMPTKDLVNELTDVKLGTVRGQLVMEEARRRLGLYDDVSAELRQLRAPENIRRPESARSLELVVNDVITLNHPDPISMLFEQINLMAQATRMLDAETFGKVTAKLQAMRAFSDVIDFRHSLMNLNVVLKITDQGDVDVTYRPRQMYPHNMMVSQPGNVFGAPPYNHMATSGMGSAYNPTMPAGDRPSPSITLPLASFIERVIEGDEPRVQLTAAFLDGDARRFLLWDTRADVTPVGALTGLTNTYGEDGLLKMLEEIAEHKAEYVLHVYPGFSPRIAQIHKKRNSF